MTPRNAKKVFLGLAIGNGQQGSTRWETSMSLIRLLTASIPGYDFYLCPGGGCDIAHSRNLMNHEFRNHTDCGLALFIDSDVEFTPDHVLALIRVFEQNPAVMVCGGLYPRKGLPLHWSYGLWSKESAAHPGLWEVGEICTGFLAYRYELQEQLIEAYPESSYMIEDGRFCGETGYELFAMGPVAERDWLGNGKPYRRRLSEDFMFSFRVRDTLHHALYVDPQIQLGHIGALNYLRLLKQA